MTLANYLGRRLDDTAWRSATSEVETDGRKTPDRISDPDSVAKAKSVVHIRRTSTFGVAEEELDDVLVPFFSGTYQSPWTFGGEQCATAIIQYACL